MEVFIKQVPFDYTFSRYFGFRMETSFWIVAIDVVFTLSQLRYMLSYKFSYCNVILFSISPLFDGCNHSSSSLWSLWQSPARKMCRKRLDIGTCTRVNLDSSTQHFITLLKVRTSIVIIFSLPNTTWYACNRLKENHQNRTIFVNIIFLLNWHNFDLILIESSSMYYLITIS